MSARSSSSGDFNFFHIPEITRGVWQNSWKILRLPFDLVWKNVRPEVYEVLARGNDATINGILAMTRGAIQTLMYGPIMPMPAER